MQITIFLQLSSKTISIIMIYPYHCVSLDFFHIRYQFPLLRFKVILFSYMGLVWSPMFFVLFSFFFYDMFHVMTDDW